MRIALIADLHGNIISLDAVLADIEAAQVDQIVCLGDVAGLGSHPREVVERLRWLDCPVVMGNADEFLLDLSLLDPARHHDSDDLTMRLHAIEHWSAEQLRGTDLDFIRTFQSSVKIPLGHDASLVCYHGSPNSSREEIRASTPDAELAEKLGDERALVMAGGHTHEQFVRRLHQTVVMNPGSVGLPYETFPDGGDRNPPWAEYAVVAHDGERLDIDLLRVPVDQVAIRGAILTSGMPYAETWAADWR